MYRVPQFLHVSTHAPARGATVLTRSHPGTFMSFNPRSRTGSDKARLVTLDLVSPVSTHAPARGATHTSDRPSFYRDRFNPRSRTGSDSRPDARGDSPIMFQPTLPKCPSTSYMPVSTHAPARGATHALVRIRFEHVSFNPRSRTGSDRSSLAAQKETLDVSTHAPARGATRQPEDRR